MIYDDMIESYGTRNNYNRKETKENMFFQLWRFVASVWLKRALAVDVDLIK